MISTPDMEMMPAWDWVFQTTYLKMLDRGAGPGTALANAHKQADAHVGKRTLTKRQFSRPQPKSGINEDSAKEASERLRELERKDTDGDE